jgi:tripartite-type tricarboxylate transporter receptor subunit TctC
VKQKQLFVAIVLGIAFLFGGIAHAYPDKTITIVVPYDAGGVVDVTARALAKHLSEKWGKSVVVENAPGAGGQIGATRVARSAPDGYTLLVAADAVMAVNPYVFSKLPYKPNDFVPISSIVGAEPTLVVKKSLPANNFSELLALAKKQPGQLSFGSFGFATNGHLWILEMQQLAGVTFNIIHYKGVTGSLKDVVAGQIDVAFVNANSARAPMAADLIKILAVSGVHRKDEYPDIPTMNETLPGYAPLGWYGLWAPAGTPTDIIAALNAEVRELDSSQEFQEKYLKRNSWTPIAKTPDEFQKFIETEQARWRAVVRTFNVHL